MLESVYKHPQGLWLLTVCYALFMAAFGGILATMVLYQTQKLHMPTDSAYGVFAAAMALLNILPLAGGYIADKLGYMNTARVGLILGVVGMACFCLSSVQAMYLGLALFVVCNALVTPAVWCMVDLGYAKNSVLREAGFTLFYLYFNIGAISGIFLGGWLADAYGFAVEFSFDSFCMLASFLVLQLWKGHVVPYQGRSITPQVSWSHWKILLSLVLCVVVATPVTVMLFHDVTVNNILTLALLLVMCVTLVVMAFKLKNRVAKNKLLAFVFLALISVAFWTLYSLEPSFLSVFVQNNVDTHFLGINIPASSYFAFDGVFVILLGFVLSRVWFYLDSKGKNPSLSLKFALSLLIIGAGFVVLACVTKVHGNSHLLPSYYVVLAYAIFAAGELLVGPLGISMVGSLAPEGKEGLMMGFWQLCIGIGGVVAGYIAMAPNLPDQALPLAQTNPLYIEVFAYVGAGAILAGVIVLALTRKLSRLMTEHAYQAPQL